MKSGFVLLLFTLLVGQVHAQEMLFHQPQVLNSGGAESYMLAPMDRAVVSDVPFLQPPGSVTGVRGTIGGQGATNRFDVSVGFDYLVPKWSTRDFLLAVPAGFEPLFPVLGNIGAVDNHFAFSPRINLNYYVSDVDFAVGTSGKFVNLTGKLVREATSTAGQTGKLDADSSLTIVSVNLVQLSSAYAFLDLFPRKEGAKESVVDSVIDLMIGTRYSAIDQNYTGTLTGGPNGTSITSRQATQNFRGIGLTTGATWTFPCGDDLLLFTSNTASILVGDNRRTSNVNVTATGQPGFAAVLSDTRTSYIPILETELGGEWGQDLADRLRTGAEPPRFSVRVAFLAQFYGDVGPVSASSSHGFQSNDLYLLGINVLAGLRY